MLKQHLCRLLWDRERLVRQRETGETERETGETERGWQQETPTQREQARWELQHSECVPLNTTSDSSQVKRNYRTTVQQESPNSNTRLSCYTTFTLCSQIQIHATHFQWRNCSRGCVGGHNNRIKLPHSTTQHSQLEFYTFWEQGSLTFCLTNSGPCMTDTASKHFSLGVISLLWSHTNHALNTHDPCSEHMIHALNTHDPCSEHTWSILWTNTIHTLNAHDPYSEHHSRLL